MLTWKLQPQQVVRSISLPFSPWLPRDEFFARAIALIGGTAPVEPAPVAVLARIRTAVPRVITPELAKTVLDALHDRKKLPPHYRDAGLNPMLQDDSPAYLTALGLELQVDGTDGVELVVARDITVLPRLLAQIDIPLGAPNDISSGGSDEQRRVLARTRYLAAVRDGWPTDPAPAIESCAVVVVRHGPQRDEDNTWATWIGALQGSRAWARIGWAPGRPPLNAAWRASAVASVRDDDLTDRVRYELYE